MSNDRPQTAGKRQEIIQRLEDIEHRYDVVLDAIKRLVIQLDHRGIKIPIEKIIPSP